MTPTQAPAQPASRPLVGVAWMAVTGLLFVCVIGIVRYMGDAIPPAQAAFLRYALGLLFILPMLGALRGGQVGWQAHRVMMLRGAIHSIAVILWFYAMARIPMAEVTAIGYLSPVFVTIGAAIFFGEKLAARRILAIVIALAGAFVILRPGLRELSPGHVAQTGTAFVMAFSYLMAKRLTVTVSSPAIVAMLSIWVTICLFPFALADWVTPTLEQVLLLLAVAFFATAGHYTMTLAFRAAPMAVTQPVTFLQLVWASALGLVIFAEPVDAYVIAGGATIIAAVSYISYREAVLNRQVTPPNVATK